MAENGDFSGYQQQFYMDTEDSVRVLTALESSSEVKYWRLNLQSTDRTFPSYSNIDELTTVLPVGVSKTGGLYESTVGVQLPPFLSIPVRTLEIRPRHGSQQTVYMQELPKAGMPLLSWGGWCEKTGEIISGRLTFTTWIDTPQGRLDFRNRLEHYHRVLLLAKNQGAREIKGWLIGPSAWKKYQNGVPLVYKTGLTAAARFSAADVPDHPADIPPEVPPEE